MKNVIDKENATLSTNGLTVYNAFPIVQYEKIHKTITLSYSSHPMYNHYAGSWNALAYRFKGAFEHGDLFIMLIDKDGATPPPEERYQQEKTLFDFFSSCFSVFESTFYGLYTLGVFIAPVDFSLTSPRDQQQVSPTRTKEAYARAFPNDPILSAFNTLFDDGEYQKLRDIRNILTHRSAPGRRSYIGIEPGETPKTEWKLNNKIIDSALIKESKKELTRLITYLLDNSVLFVEHNL